MKKRLGYVLAFLAGVVCTAVVYEVVGVITTAGQAITAASNQFGAGDDDEGVVAASRAPSSRPVQRPSPSAKKPARPGVKRSARPEPQKSVRGVELPKDLIDDPRLDPELRAEMALKREAFVNEQLKDPMAARRARRAARKERLEAMSPEEREAVLERRRERRARRAERRARLNGQDEAPATPGVDRGLDGTMPADDGFAPDDEGLPPIEPDTGLP